MQKPKYAIDISDESQSSLEAHISLSMLNTCNFFHLPNGFRHPLGIYNISVSRICEKITRLCSNLENYIQLGNTLDPLDDHDEEMQLVIDYIELALYASAEHVDDITSIALGFFPTKTIAIKDHSYRKLQKSIKEHKKLIATTANHIKHKQSRIRMFSVEIQQGGEAECLHGFFFEGVDMGVVCPNKTIHQDQDVLSITTFIWEIIYLLLNLSKELAAFLQSSTPLISGPPNIQFPKLPKAVIAPARLPLYTFGEEHPFARATLIVKSTNDKHDELNSGLYGSIHNCWSKTLGVSFGKNISRFEGDGTTKQFKFVLPKTLSLQHWN